VSLRAAYSADMAAKPIKQVFKSKQMNSAMDPKGVVNCLDLVEDGDSILNQLKNELKPSVIFKSDGPMAENIERI
jgi:hypothetical protein